MSSFKPKETLNPAIFDKNQLMKPDVREALLQISKDFYEDLGVDWVDYSDIWLTGSNAGYNWSKYSDIDLHVLMPYSEVSNHSDLTDEFFWAKKDNWNNNHDLKIEDYEIELYVQNDEDDQSTISDGIYSVLNDKWISKPQKKIGRD